MLIEPSRMSPELVLQKNTVHLCENLIKQKLQNIPDLDVGVDQVRSSSIHCFGVRQLVQLLGGLPLGKVTWLKLGRESWTLKEKSKHTMD